MTEPSKPPAGEEAPASITIKPKGPYLVRGGVTLQDTEGNVITPPPAKTPGLIKLCSCGQSASKPFCDGTHNKC